MFLQNKRLCVWVCVLIKCRNRCFRRTWILFLMLFVIINKKSFYHQEWSERRGSCYCRGVKVVVCFYLTIIYLPGMRIFIARATFLFLHSFSFYKLSTFQPLCQFFSLQLIRMFIAQATKNAPSCLVVLRSLYKLKLCIQLLNISEQPSSDAQ